MSDFNKIFIYRMVHIGNVKHILQYGITHAASPQANTSYIAIGDTSIISNRHSFVLPNGKLLGQYIPFYFGPRMPMLYVIQNGFNGVEPIAPENIVYCVVSVQQILNHQLPFVFTNGHAISGLTEYFNEADLVNIEKIIDKKAIKEPQWKNDIDIDLKRRKEAEFLVASDIPATAIVGWCVYNEKAKDFLLHLDMPNNHKIAVKPEYYY